MKACIHNNYPIVKYIFENFNHADIQHMKSFRDDKGNIALHYACRSSNYKIALEIADENSLKQLNDEENNPLCEAWIHGKALTLYHLRKKHDCDIILKGKSLSKHHRDKAIGWFHCLMSHVNIINNQLYDEKNDFLLSNPTNIIKAKHIADKFESPLKIPRISNLQKNRINIKTDPRTILSYIHIYSLSRLIY